MTEAVVHAVTAECPHSTQNCTMTCSSHIDPALYETCTWLGEIWMCILLWTTDQRDHDTRPLEYQNSEQVCRSRLEPVITNTLRSENRWYIDKNMICMFSVKSEVYCKLKIAGFKVNHCFWSWKLQVSQLTIAFATIGSSIFGNFHNYPKGLQEV